MSTILERTMKKAAVSIVPAFILCMMMLLGSAQQVHAQDYAINETNFPDENFRSFVSSFDNDHNGVLSQAEADSVTEIWSYSNDYEFDNLKGIEIFRNLEQIYFESARVKSLDVSKNTALKSISLNYSDLTRLDLSKNTAIQYVYVDANELTSIVLPKNSNLVKLSIFGNKFKTLDLSNCKKLKYLDCGGNELTTLDLSDVPGLEELHCIANRGIKKLDLSKAPKLKRVTCSSNSFTTLDISNNLNLMYAYQKGSKSSWSKEGVEVTEYYCMYGSDSYNLTTDQNVKIDDGGGFVGKKGDTIQTSEGFMKILSTSSKTLAFTYAANKKSVKIPATVKVNCKKYKVIQIDPYAFTNDQNKVRTVTVGKNVKKIGDHAFNLSKTTKLILNTKLLKKGKIKNSLSDSKIKTVQVKVGKKSVNKKYVKTYKKIFTKANAGRKVKVK